MEMRELADATGGKRQTARNSESDPSRHATVWWRQGNSIPQNNSMNVSCDIGESFKMRMS